MNISKGGETICRIVRKNHNHRRRPRIPKPFNATRFASSHGILVSETTPLPSTVVLLRHGQSLWNKIPTFTGWCDVPLTDLGVEQAEGAARLMKEKGYDFDLVYSSELKRAYRTAEVVLETMNDPVPSRQIEPTKGWELNERQYVVDDLMCEERQEQFRYFYRYISSFIQLYVSNGNLQLWGFAGFVEIEPRTRVHVW